MTDISNPEQLRRQTLDLLRFPLAIVVMLIHIWPSPLTDASISESATNSILQYPVLRMICTVINAFMRAQSVPIYFFIAGYVFFYNVDFNKETYIKKLKNRAKTLFIPYIIWNTIALLLIMVKFLAENTMGHQLLNPTNIELDISLKNILNCYWFYNGNIFGLNAADPAGPINGPLWFIRVLIILVLFTPILYQLIKRLKHFFVIGVGLIWFLIGSFDLEIPIFYRQLLSGVFFFSYGAYMSIHKRDMLVEFGRYFQSSMIIYLSLGILYIISVYCYPEACPIIKRLNILVGLLFAYNLASWLLRKEYCKVSPFLASSAFFIYVSHTLIVYRITNLLLHYINADTDIKRIILYLIISVLTIGILLGIFYLLRRYTPNLLKVLIGRK